MVPDIGCWPRERGEEIAEGGGGARCDTDKEEIRPRRQYRLVDNNVYGSPRRLSHHVWKYYTGRRGIIHLRTPLTLALTSSLSPVHYVLSLSSCRFLLKNYDTGLGGIIHARKPLMLVLTLSSIPTFSLLCLL